jgi:hypothetical protein
MQRRPAACVRFIDIQYSTAIEQLSALAGLLRLFDPLAFGVLVEIIDLLLCVMATCKATRMRLASLHEHRD